jgi:uncharacterized protein
MIWIGLAVALLLALAAARHLLHRSLAPERLRGTASPADLGLAHADVRIPTANGRSLFGWQVPAAGPGPHPAAVLVHGWGGSAGTMLPLARPLHDAGFVVLLFDARCHGRSDEDSFASLPRFAEDCAHAVAWLRAREEVDRNAVCLVGHSVGAGAVLLAAARDPGIAAVVSIAAFRHPEDMMRRWFRWRGIPSFPVGALILRYIERVIGHRFGEIAPINTVRDVRCPVLLVHGADDETVPVDDAHDILAAGGAGVRLQIVAGSHDDYADLSRELPPLIDFLRSALERREEGR